MLTIGLVTILAMGVMILAYVTVIHKLLISKQMSDKLSKNFALAFLGFAVYVTGVCTIIMSWECIRLIGSLKSGKLKFDEMSETINTFLIAQHGMSLLLIASIISYGLLLLLVKNIHHDIQIETEKPKYRWGNDQKKSTL